MSNNTPEEQAQQAAIEAQRQQQQQDTNQQTPVATEPLNTQTATDQSQIQKDQQASQKIEKSIDENNADKEYKTNLRTLQRIVAQASPIIEVRKDGAKVTTGYNYYAVDGKPVEEWVQETFGGKVTLDKENRKITVNDQNKQQNQQPQQAQQQQQQQQ